MTETDHLAPLRRAPGVIRLHGHRGARGVLPENTMEGFAFALSIGLEALEFDVLLSADDVPVITHNARLSPDFVRDSQGNWVSAPGPVVRALTAAELSRYEVGALRRGRPYGTQFGEQSEVAGARIPPLAELAALLARPEHRRVWLNLEVKSSPLHPDWFAPPPEAAAAILAVLTAHGVRGRTLVQSFDWRVLSAFRRLAPDLPLSYLSAVRRRGAPGEANIYPGSPWMDGRAARSGPADLPALVAAAGGQVWSPHFRDLTRDDLAAARERDLLVNVWTVNEIGDIDRMIEFGVDGIITDYPGRVQHRLRAHGMGWR